MDGVHDNYFGDQHHWPQSKLGREEHGHRGPEMCGSDPGFALAYQAEDDVRMESQRRRANSDHREAMRKDRGGA